MRFAFPPYFAAWAASRFFGFGQRTATRGNTSSISRRVCAITSSSPWAAGLRMSFETAAAQALIERLSR
jgi:hypothetical protein